MTRGSGYTTTKLNSQSQTANYLDKLICDGMVKPREGYSYNG